MFGGLFRGVPLKLVKRQCLLLFKTATPGLTGCRPVPADYLTPSPEGLPQQKGLRLNLHRCEGGGVVEQQYFGHDPPP